MLSRQCSSHKCIQWAIAAPKRIPILPQISFRFIGSSRALETLLSKPTWSVHSLLQTETTLESPIPTVTAEQLRHLLRLSALPEPVSSEEESEMLKTLQSQLYFVKEIQSVDTSGIVALQAIRDETETGTREQVIGLDVLREALNQEDTAEKTYNRRPRRRRQDLITVEQSPVWDALGTAELVEGRYFVVQSKKS